MNIPQLYYYGSVSVRLHPRNFVKECQDQGICLSGRVPWHLLPCESKIFDKNFGSRTNLSPISRFLSSTKSKSIESTYRALTRTRAYFCGITVSSNTILMGCGKVGPLFLSLLSAAWAPTLLATKFLNFTHWYFVILGEVYRKKGDLAQRIAL